MEVRCQDDTWKCVVRMIAIKGFSKECGRQEDQGFKRNFKDDKDTLQDGA